MSEQPVTPEIPEFDLADRLRKSLRHADVSVQSMAEYLEVSRNTIGNWINGHTRPRPAELKMWALRCGVDHVWLSTGLPRMDSNHQPAGWLTDSSTPPSTRELKNMGVPIDELRQRIRYGTLREAR